MRKYTLSTIAAVTLLFGGLAGCGADNQNNMGAQNYRESYPMTERGTTGARYSGEGPITDMFTDEDRYAIQERSVERNRRTYEQRFMNRNDTRILRERAINNERTNQLRPQESRIQPLNTERIERIVEQMNGVNEAHVISHGRSVVIGIDTNAKDSQQLENRIKQRVQQLTKNYDVYVVTDKDQLGRIETLGERMRTGGSEALQEVGETFNEIIDDITDAARRPFERAQ